MTKKQLVDFITRWNAKYPYDKVWRSKNKIPLFSPDHKSMTLVDIFLEVEEDRLYREALDEYNKQKEREDNSIVTSLSEKEYIKGQGNWLNASEDNMSDEEIDEIFNKIKF
jgi:hypothetical protein